MQKVQLKQAKKYHAGFPLVLEEDVVSEWQEGWCTFADEQKKPLGVGYLSKQNKGVGWILCRDFSQSLDRLFFVNRFRAAKAARAFYFQNEQTNVFRVLNGEGDGIGGLSVDWYAGHAVISWYNSFLYSQKKIIVDAFLEVFSDVRSLVEKVRFSAPNLSESTHIWGEEAPAPLLVKENGVTFATYLNDGLMTGIFLDQMDVRGALLDGEVSGKNVLNLFSYTGAFSVAAALGGARSTTSVDLAKRSVPKTIEQFQVNGLELATHKIVVMDVLKYFDYAKKKELTYDTIVIDPPSFARNGKKIFRVAKNYGELIAGCVPILERKGTIFASTNAANVSLKKFRAMIEEELQKFSASYKFIEMYRLPGDFKVSEAYPEGNYLKVFKIEVEKS